MLSIDSGTKELWGPYYWSRTITCSGLVDVKIIFDFKSVYRNRSGAGIEICVWDTIDESCW